MARMSISAILWRRYLAATSHAVWAVNNSQYYFELTGSYEGFFDGAARKSSDDEGNETFAITLEAFEGSPSVDPYEVIFTKKRATAAREGMWTVDSIRDGKKRAYDLWRKGRGPEAQYNQLPEPDKNQNYIVVVRDTENKFHGRWIRGGDFEALPKRVKELLASKNCGWNNL